MDWLRELSKKMTPGTTSDTETLQLIRLAYYFKDPAVYGQQTQTVLRETAKRYQDALDDCEVQIVSFCLCGSTTGSDDKQAGSEMVSRAPTCHKSSSSQTESLGEYI